MRWSLAIALLVGIVGFAVALGAIRWAAGESQNRDTRQEKTDRALCEIIAVQLSTRANRKETVKLFSSIREQDPPLFDKLVRRAAKGDRRIARAKKDLPCETFPTLRTPEAKKREARKRRAERLRRQHASIPGNHPEKPPNGSRGGEPSNPPPGNSQPPPPPVDSGGGGGSAAPEPEIRIGPIEIDLPDLPLIPDLPKVSLP